MVELVENRFEVGGVISLGHAAIIGALLRPVNQAQARDVRGIGLAKEAGSRRVTWSGASLRFSFPPNYPGGFILPRPSRLAQGNDTELSTDLLPPPSLLCYHPTYIHHIQPSYHNYTNLLKAPPSYELMIDPSLPTLPRMRYHHHMTTTTMPPLPPPIRASYRINPPRRRIKRSLLHALYMVPLMALSGSITLGILLGTVDALRAGPSAPVQPSTSCSLFDTCPVDTSHVELRP